MSMEYLTNKTNALTGIFFAQFFRFDLEKMQLVYAVKSSDSNYLAVDDR